MSKKKEENESWNISVSTIIIRALVGGSLGTLATSFASSDLPKIALGGIFGGGIAPIVLAFTEPISQKLKIGARSSGQIIADESENTFQRWRTNLSKFESNYLKALQTYCYALEVEGFSGNLPTLALQDIFIPLRLSTEVNDHTYEVKHKNLDIWNFIPNISYEKHDYKDYKFAIIAKPGYGKTTLTRYLAFCYSCPIYEQHKATKLLPILLRLRSIYRSIESERQPSLEKIIVAHIKTLPRCEKLQLTDAWMRKQLEEGNCLVMFDGLDEVPEGRAGQLRRIVSSWVYYQMMEYPSVFILTSRPHGYDSSLFPGIRQLSILDFSNEQKKSFLTKWYQNERWHNHWKILWKDSLNKAISIHISQEQARAQSQSEAQVAADDLYRQMIISGSINTQLAANPLLLTIIAATHRAFDSLPDRRVNLYRKMFGLLLEDRPKHRDIRLTIKDVDDNQDILQIIAINLTRQGKTQFTHQQAKKWISEALNERSKDKDFTANQYLREVEQITGLLVGGDSNLYEFSHKTFQEFFVAIDFYNKNTNIILVDLLLTKPIKEIESWKEIFSFYSALSSADYMVETIQKIKDEEKQNHLIIFLINIVIEDKCKIHNSENKKIFDYWMMNANIQIKDGSRLLLEQKLNRLIHINNHASITIEPITWGEYQEFLESQHQGRFHSTAKDIDILSEQLELPVTGISYQDRTWFCAWLPTQVSSNSEFTIFDYRVPTINQLKKSGREPDQFHIIKVKLKVIYLKLVNLLINEEWIEANEETQIIISNLRKSDSYLLSTYQIKKIPCKDLEIIDNLWTKYSGGFFGLSAQREIWRECGSPLSNDLNWKKYCERVGWEYKSDSQFFKNTKGELFQNNKIHRNKLTIKAHLPYITNIFTGKGLEEARFINRFDKCYSSFSHPQ